MFTNYTKLYNYLILGVLMRCKTSNNSFLELASLFFPVAKEEPLKRAIHGEKPPKDQICGCDVSSTN